MSDDTFDEPSEETEAYESLDESLDDEDLQGVGPEGERDVDSDLVADQTELEESGAELDDPERMSILDGGMDDPDGSGPPPRRPGGGREAGWDVDPVASSPADEGEEEDDSGRPGPSEPDEVDIDPGELE